jgi:DNA invertase Pin-like site-specific DNA recombinase
VLASPPASDRAGAVTDRLARLETLDLSAMRQEWRRLYRAEPPRLSRDLMMRALAYRIQEIAFGGLSKATLRRLAALSAEFESDGRIATPAQPRIKLGARLLRDWHGRTHAVVVTEEGFEFEGKLYRSLTGIAREITGAAWSGPRFLDSPGLPAPPEETIRRSASPIGTAGASTTRHNAWRRRMSGPRQEGSSSIEPEAEAKRAARGSLRKSTREAPSNIAGGRKIRCAIYTRKSSEEGLEQEFNSLDAQREACEAFVRSQKHEGWSVLPQLYDDPGYSGGTMERPALKRLLADIAAHRIDAVVVHKVDRLTRSLSDFAKIVEVFDAHSVSFVSITQAFNTTTSMGRLTLNVLPSFAQFEREVTGERIRDKIAASKRKGLWMGGQPSLGYDVRDRKLVVNEAEAAIVRMIFRRYLELGSVRALKAALDEEGVVSKQRIAADGSPYGGKSFSRGALYLMLQNRIYRGEIVHKGTAHPGEHAPIIDEDLWTSVQLRLEANGVERRETLAPASSNLLTGMLFDADGQSMTPTHAIKKGVRYRYYVSRSLVTGTRSEEGNRQISGQRIPAANLEGLVVQRRRSFFADPVAVIESLPPHRRDAPSQKRATEATKAIARALDDRRDDAWRTIFRPISSAFKCAAIASTSTSAQSGSSSGYSKRTTVTAIRSRAIPCRVELRTTPTRPRPSFDFPCPLSSNELV